MRTIQIAAHKRNDYVAARATGGELATNCSASRRNGEQVEEWGEGGGKEPQPKLTKLPHNNYKINQELAARQINT